jgi:hypothetical protein
MIIYLFGATHISKHNMPFMIDDNICRIDVSIDDLIAVQLWDGWSYWDKYISSNIVGYYAKVVDDLWEFVAWDILKKEIVVFLILLGFIIATYILIIDFG